MLAPYFMSVERQFMRLVTVLVLAMSAAGPRVGAQTPGAIVIARDGARLTLSWNCVPGRSYQLQESGDLAGWLDVETVPKPLVATTNRLSYSMDLPLLPSKQFYRVTELPDDTNNFQLEVTTTNSPQAFICRFVEPGTLHVDWGDGSNEDFNATITNSHTYATAGVYTIKLSGHVHLIDLFIYPDPGLGTPKLVSAIKTPIRGITGLTSAYEMFKHCENIPSIPEGLFDECPGITTFYDTFLACKKITSIPAGLFDAQTNVTTFYATFDNCDLLREIPPGLFDKHTNVTNFAWTFAKCYSITSIPAGLFDRHRKVTTFDHVFYRCYALQSIPPLLFDKNTAVTTYARAFEDCSQLTGASPANAAGQKLWELVPLVNGTSCFKNCTNLTDYATIPAAWKQ
jgi:hypothetical protein